MSRHEVIIIPKTQNGFTLLEVLVAFSILALTLGTLYQVFATGFNAHKTAEGHTVAVIIAQSVLAELGATRTVKTGQWQGTEYLKYQWLLSIKPIELMTHERFADGNPVHPYKVVVTVNWSDSLRNHSLHLTSIRLSES